MSKTRLYTLRPLASAIVLALSGPVGAAVIPVDGTTCTLVDAIRAANTDAAVGGCVAGSGADTLNLTAPRFTAAVPVETTTPTPTAFPLITSLVTVNGDPDGDRKGAVIERSEAPGTPAFQLLAVGPAGNLSLQRVTLRNAARAGIYVRGIYGEGYGRDDGVLSVTHSTITGTVAHEGGAAAIQVASHGRAFLSHSALIDNDGDGLMCLEPYTTSCAVSHSRITGNVGIGISAPDYSAGSVTDSTISGNGTGAVGNLYLQNVTVSGNRGIGVMGFGGGGTTMRLLDSTVSGNEGDGAVGGALVVRRSTITGNGGLGLNSRSASRFGGIRESIVSGNRGGDCFINTEVGGPADLTGNLIGDGSCEAAAHGAQTGDPKLGPLLDNGGPTFTHALLRDSPALDVVPVSACAAKDQRGATRPQGAACDLGAYESVTRYALRVRPILSFFDQTVQAGTLTGTLHAPNRWHGLQAVRRQLLLAGDLDAHGAKASACKQTTDTLCRIDAEGATPDANDYVTGAAAPELADQLRALRTAIGCR